MNRLLRMSAGLLGTIVLATGANSVVSAKNACPKVDSSCDSANACSVLSNDCSGSNCSDLQSIADQCSSNTDLLKALIESGNCSSNDLKCLIDSGTCTVDDVCTALEGCNTDCTDIKEIIEDVACASDSGCISGDTTCGTDIDVIKSLFDSVECRTDSENCNSECGEDCEDVKSPITINPTSPASVNPVVQVVEQTGCTTVKVQDTSCQPCDSDCDVNSNCEDGNCSVNDCSDGSCADDAVKSILEKYGMADCDINTVINNGSCRGSNGRYTITYGNSSDINSILESFGLGSQNTQKQDAESKPVQEDSNTNTDTVNSVPADTTTVKDNASYSVSDYEREVADLVNEIRAEYGLNPLTLNSELSAVARTKSEDMRDNHYFSHTSPTYGSPFDMMKSFGISYRTAGENIAMGQRTPEEVVNAWMNSEGHRANILNASFTEIGVGYAANGNYWTQMFIG